MGFQYSCSLALSFQLLLLMCGPGIYAVKDLREKQQDTYHGKSSLSGTGDSDIGEYKDFPQLIKEFEDKYSSLSGLKNEDTVEMNPSSHFPSQLVKELEDKYSSLSGLKNEDIVERNPSSYLPSQLVKELDDIYSSLSVDAVKRNPSSYLPSQLDKELDDIYSSIRNVRGKTFSSAVFKNHE